MAKLSVKERLKVIAHGLSKTGAQHEYQREQARKVGMSERALNMQNPWNSPTTEEIVKKGMEPPSRADIETHIRNISAGRPGVPDNGGYKKKKVK